MTRKILAADMWPSLTFANPNEIYSDFLAVGRDRFKNLIEALLLYDEVYIPTDSFMSLTILVGVLGEDAVQALIECGALRFVRFEGALAYAGNGAGLTDFKVGRKEDEPLPMFASSDVAIRWALFGLNTPVDVSALSLKVLEATQDIPLTEILEDVQSKTYRTLQESADLRSAYLIKDADLRKLPGIGPAGVRVWPGFDKPTQGTPDAIDGVLRVARGYMEGAAAEKIGATDVSTATPIGFMIASEEAREGLPLSRLQQFSNVPDVGEGVLSKRLEIRELIKLRTSRHWPAFRDWFHANYSSDPIETAKAYIDLLKQVPLADSFAGRTIRLITTSALGLLGPLAGIGSAAVDTYVVPELHPSSAKFFIDKLEQLAPKQR